MLLGASLTHLLLVCLFGHILSSNFQLTFAENLGLGDCQTVTRMKEISRAF